MKNTLIDKELASLTKKRMAYLKQYATKKELAPELAAKVPEKLRSTLNAAFTKAFELTYKNGTSLIDKTYNKQNAEEQYQINRFAYELRQNKKSIRAFSKQSNASNAVNLLISGVEGIGHTELQVNLSPIICQSRCFLLTKTATANTSFLVRT